MAFRQRTITGTVVDGDGTPIINGEVKFQPTKQLAYTTTHIVVDAAFTVQTENDGSFEIDLWCDEDSLVQVDYNVYFPTVDGGAANTEHRASFSLQYGDGSPINLAVLINSSVPAPTPEELLYTLILQLIQENSSGGIGTPLSGGTSGSVLFVNEDEEMAQAPDNLNWDNTLKQLNIKSSSVGLFLQNVNEYWSTLLTLKSNGYNSSAKFTIGDSLLQISCGANDSGGISFQNESTAVGAIRFYTGYNPTQRAKFDANGAGVIPLLLALAASQTADALQIQNSAGTVLTSIASNGAWIPATLSDAAAPNKSIFIGSDHSNKLCFKDGSGTVNVLY